MSTAVIDQQQRQQKFHKRHQPQPKQQQQKEKGPPSSPNNNDFVEGNREMSTQAATAAITSTTTAAGTGASSVPVIPGAVDSSSSTLPLSSLTSSNNVVVVGGSGTGSGSHTTHEQHCRLLEDENQQLKETESRLQQQYADSQRRERLLMRRLTNKEQELQDYVAQIAEYKNAQAPGAAALRSAMLDPAVNILFEKLKTELQSTRAKLEESQNELSAWKFTPDSNTGKRLMAKCRLLYQENEELGKMTSNGRLAKLEGELAMQKSFNEEVKKSQSELDDFIQELDEDVEGMQSTILFLQQELKAAKDRIQFLEKENCQSKNGSTIAIGGDSIEDDDDNIDDGDETDNGKPLPLVNGSSSPKHKIGRDLSDCYASDERTTKFNKNSTYHIVHNSNNSIILRTTNISSTDESRTSSLFNGNHNELTPTAMAITATAATTVNGGVIGSSSGGCSDIDTKAQNDSINSYLESSSGSNNSNLVLNSKTGNRLTAGQRKRNYDSDSSGENSSTNGCTLRSNKKLKKKARRSSVLSIDLNEEDTQIADESDEDEASSSSVTATAMAATTAISGTAGTVPTTLAAITTTATPAVSATNQRIMTRRKSARNHQNGAGAGGDHN